MEFNLITIVELINHVGFPIATCIALFWFTMVIIREQQKLLTELRDIISHNSEVMKDLIDEIKRNNP